jgi:hypothetical protein
MRYESFSIVLKSICPAGPWHSKLAWFTPHWNCIGMLIAVTGVMIWRRQRQGKVKRT